MLRSYKRFACSFSFLGLETYNAILTSFGFNSDDILFTSLYLIIIFLGVTEIIGLKGRVFRLPTWLYFVLFTMLVGLRLSTLNYWGNFILVAGLGFAILRISDIKFRKAFAQSRAAIKTVADKNIDTMEKRKELWAAIKAGYIFPSKGYLYMYPVYRRIHPDTVRQEDFVDHYLIMLSLIKNNIPPNP